MNFKENIFGFDDYVDPFLCNSWVGTAIVGGSILGGISTAYAANKAAGSQTSAANTAAQTTMNMYNTTRGDLSSYRDIGNVAAGDLTTALPTLTAPVSVNPDDFLNSDQYKFLQTQGERAVTNSSAARGLGTSGAALKGSAAFESGLNASQWQSNFNNQVTNTTNTYNRLKGLIDTGETAAAGGGVLGASAANTAAGAAIGAGNASAAATNAIGGAVSNTANNLGGYAAYKGLYGTGSSSGTGGAPYTSGPLPGTSGSNYYGPAAPT